MNPNRALASLSAVVFAVACNGGSDEVTLPDEAEDVVAHYAMIAEAAYADSLAAAEDLDEALEALVATPTAVALGDARDAWLASREPYLQTEVFRFYDGPIDNPTDGPEGLLNAWPLDENYVDYVDGDADAGIVNDAEETIDAANLASLNEAGGEKNISTGYHAIEFLLWGQDMDDAGPGARPYTDYVTDGGGTAANQDRRGTYLTVAGDMMVGDLGQVHDEWATDGEYRTAFVADAEGSFEKILTGMIVLSGFETGGERLQASLDSGDQEDEHSCFSDNTHRDMVQDVQGILNVWEGSYTPLEGAEMTGPGVKDVVAAVDADLADTLDARIAESLELAEALQPPYDQEIAAGNTEGRARVQALVTSLMTQEELLGDVFELFGMTVPDPE